MIFIYHILRSITKEKRHIVIQKGRLSLRRKIIRNLILTVFLLSFFNAIGIHEITEISRLQRLNEGTVTSSSFRDHRISNEMLEYLIHISDKEFRAEHVGLYLLETRMGHQSFAKAYSEESFRSLRRRWSRKEEYVAYIEICKALWGDLKFFPVPISVTNPNLRVSFTDSWMHERTFGGARGHEGTDIIPNENTPGLFPIVSMTDGVVTSMGWLEKGGHRVGITSPSGGYFYYAHLDSYADIQVGDTIRAGELLGFMGDTGYGPEETRGKFVVHLHVGIYMFPDGIETSVNPYWMLRYLENYKIKANF